MRIDELERMTLSEGEVAMIWLNIFSGVAIRTPKRMIIIDPTEVRSEEFNRADAILVTHEHADHLDVSLIEEIFRRVKCPIIADAISAEYLKNSIPRKNLLLASIGSEINIGEVRVYVERSVWNWPEWRPVTYFIESEDKVRIYHSGDSPPFESMKSLGEKYEPDITFCNIGGGNATPRSGAQIPSLMNPKVAIPYHASYGFTEFCQIISDQIPETKCKILKQGMIYRYSRVLKE